MRIIAKDMVCCWCLFLVTILVTRAENGTRAGKWPEIQDLVVKAHFSDQADQRKVVQIRSRSGQVLYILDARWVTEKGWDDEDEYSYSGAFDCRLYAADRSARNHATLLQNVPDATRDWETDGRFLPDELQCLAEANPSRHLVQRSALRGMRIEIDISNVKLDAKTRTPESIDVVFSVHSDPSVTKEIAAAEGN